MKNSRLIIGLTGNIATGKSVVRRMLENSGALGIDSDLLAHRMLFQNGPAYQAVIENFGNQILLENGQISRDKLGEVVFNNPEKLKLLESLVHPEVSRALRERIAHSKSQIIVIEAIKLLEAGLGKICNAIWVSHVSDSTQVERLRQFRAMSEAQARTRICAQPPQSEKPAKANVVINTEGSFKSTWQQIQQALNDTIQLKDVLAPSKINLPGKIMISAANQIHPDRLETFWYQHGVGSQESLYEHLGMQMLLPMTQDNQLTDLLLWDNWNFIGTLDKKIPAEFDKNEILSILKVFESQASEKQCELLILPDTIPGIDIKSKESVGYQISSPENLLYPAWRSAAKKLLSEKHTSIWVKILAKPSEIKKNL